MLRFNEIESVTKFKVIIEGCTYGCKDVVVKYHINRSATELWTQAVVGLLTEGSVNP